MWLIKWYLKRLNDKNTEEVLYLILTKNPKYPLTPNEAKLIIRLIKRMKRGNVNGAIDDLLREAGEYPDDRGELDDPRD